MLKLTIKDTKWNVFILDEETYEKKLGGDSAALVDKKNNQVFFNVEYLSLATVIHEVCHIYYSTLHLNDAELTAQQMEEVSCELFANEGEAILKQSKRLYRRLRGRE